jgi:response regulator RpfG family c-di-GMP phosphodiesterase
MSRTGPIILIDDDPDDKFIFQYAMKEMNIKNELIYFDNCVKALEYLQKISVQPFIIFCDINMPICTGLEFKKIIDANEELRKKSIPFIFYSTSVDQDTVNKAYLDMTIQGFFQKELNIAEIRKNIKMILEYWLVCRHPNSV